MNDEKQNNDSGMLLRAAMSAIPALAPLATWWSEFNSTKNTKRLQVLIDTLNALVACHRYNWITFRLLNWNTVWNRMLSR